MEPDITGYGQTMGVHESRPISFSQNNFTMIANIVCSATKRALVEGMDTVQCLHKFGLQAMSR